MYTSVLFVCTGNICRSPTAEGMLRHLLQKEGLSHIRVDSAGTHGWHSGEHPDYRAVAAAKERGYDISDLRSRALKPEDFEEFELMIAMDEGHYAALERLKPAHARVEIKFHSDFATNPVWKDVPDPYYGGPEHFKQAFDLIENGVLGIVKILKETNHA